MRWSNRTKAILSILVLIFGESPAILFVFGMYPGQPLPAYDLVVPVIAIAILFAIDVLATFLTFYAKVTPSPIRPKIR
jgi:hypothetical protein